MELNEAARALGRKGGLARSERKTQAVRANARKPRKYPLCLDGHKHRFRKGKCAHCGIEQIKNPPSRAGLQLMERRTTLVYPTLQESQTQKPGPDQP